LKKVAAVIALLTVAMLALPMQDPAMVGKGIYKKLAENAKCRVFEVTFKPGAKIAMHAHPMHTVYVVRGGKLEITVAGQKPQVLDLKAGQCVILDAQKHSARNVGKTTVKVAVTEIKGA
jgi:quercetin dioxygenase-like cupin family protein